MGRVLCGGWASRCRLRTLVVRREAESEVFEYLVGALVDHSALEAHQRVAGDGQRLCDMSCCSEFLPVPANKGGWLVLRDS